MNRREFLRDGAIVLAGIGALPLLSACEEPKEEQHEPQKPKEQEGFPRAGDVVVIDNKYYLLRENNLRLLTPELFEEHKRATKFESYGRKLFLATPRTIGSLPVAQPKSLLPRLIEPYTGDLKWNRRAGAEMPLFVSGFIDDKGVPYGEIRPTKETFINLRAELGRRGWDFFYSLFFTYGKKKMEEVEVEYKARDTAINPEINKKHMRDYGSDLEEELPFVQINPIGFSFGGLLALEFARARPDKVNMLTLINSPIRGIRKTVDRQALTLALRALLKFGYGVDEEVTEYLFNLWENRKYQRELDEFVEWFTASGKKLIVYISDNDPIVPVESAYLKGATKIIKGRRPPPILLLSRIWELNYLVGYFKELLSIHGEPLGHPEVVRGIGEDFGENLAAAG